MKDVNETWRCVIMREIPQFWSACGVHGGVRHVKQEDHRNAGGSSTKRGNNPGKWFVGQKSDAKTAKKIRVRER